MVDVHFPQPTDNGLASIAEDIVCRHGYKVTLLTWFQPAVCQDTQSLSAKLVSH